MRQIVDRRQRTLERARKTALQHYYENNIADSASFFSLNLNMYVDHTQVPTLKNEIYKIFSESKCNSDIHLHEEQLICLELLEKNNLLISAPTSFGKTFIAFEYIKRKEFQNVAFVVPTLALMNEISKKVRKIFQKEYKIITDSNQDVDQNEKCMFILVPERIDIRIFQSIKKLDFLVFDEIYKLKKPSDGELNNKRTIALNSAYFNLVNISEKVLLLGPYINSISFNNTKLVDNIIEFYTDFNPVFTKMILKDESAKDDFVISRLGYDNDEIVYFESPQAIFNFSLKLFDLPEKDSKENKSLIKWCKENIDEQWLPVKMLSKGIGVHHGKMPAFIKKYIEYQYERGKIHKIFCTSTLLEGVNTPTESLIIYNEDDQYLSSFAINNLIGRVGRLNNFIMGKVYYFKEDTLKRIDSSNKYIDVDIVAEIDDIGAIEEYVFLEKDDSALSPELKDEKNYIEEKLIKYGRKITDLKLTAITNFKVLLKFFEHEEELINSIKNYYYKYYSEDDVLLDYDKNKARELFKAENELFKIITSIIPMGRHINLSISNLISAIKEKHNDFSGISIYSLIHNLLKQTTNIYADIRLQIQKLDTYLDNPYKTNLLINIMFDIANEYIKFDLQMLVYILDFLYTDEYIETKEFKKHYMYFKETILKRIKSFDFGQDVVKKTLIDIGIPANNVALVHSIIRKELVDQPISYSSVLDALKNKIKTINAKKELDDITKQLIAALIE